MLSVKVFQFNPLQENSFIVYNEDKKAIIIDPGAYFDEERERLKSFLDSSALEPVLLLNTHGHLDHIFSNKWVADTYGLVPHIHRKEETVLEFAPTLGLMWNFPFDHYSGPLRYLREDEPVELGKEALKVLFTPGHSPGSVSFYSEADGFLISGDVLFNRSIGRTDLPGGDHATLIDSIRTQLWPLPDETIVYPGHGESTTIGFEKQHNPFLRD